MIALMSNMLSPSIHMRITSFFKTVLGTVLLTFSVSAAADVSVVATIRPLEFIAKAIVGDFGSTDSLIGRNASPHHFNFTPSNRQALNRADIVLWVGPEFEVHLADSMERLARGRALVTAFNLPNFKVLTLDESGSKDGHVWLSAENASAIASALAEQLSIVDPENTTSYSVNLEKFQAMLQAKQLSIKLSLSQYEDTAYLVYHNGFQYFEQEYGLNHLTPLVSDPEVSPSINQIVAVRQLIADEMPGCLISESDANQELVTTITRAAKLKIVDVDLLGYSVPLSTQAYGQLLDSIAESFASCLGASQ